MIKKVAFGIVFLIGLMILGGSAFVYFNKDVIIHEIQAQLENSDISLDLTELDVSFLKTFPSATASLADVSISSKSQAPFLHASTVTLNLNIKKLIAGDIEIKKITFRDGHIHLLKDKNGDINYQISGKNNQSSTGKNLLLDQLDLVHMDVTYQDKKQNHLVRLKNVNTSLKPTFHEKSISASIELNSTGEIITLNETSYLFNQPISLNGELRFADNSLIFTTCLLEIGENHISLDGYISELDSAAPLFNLSLTHVEGQLESISDFLPNTWFQPLDPYQISGFYKLAGTIIGKLGPNTTPFIKLNADLRHVVLHHEALVNKIEKGQGQLTFSYGNNSAGHIRLNAFKGTSNNQPLLVDFDLNSFEKPIIETQITGKLKLANINPEFIPSIFIRDEGHIYLDKFNIRFEDQISYAGTINAQNLSGLIQGIGFNTLEGIFDVNNQIIKIDSTTFEAFNQKHKLGGSLDLVNEIYNIQINTTRLNLAELFNSIDMTEEAQTLQVSETTPSSPKISLDLISKEVTYNDISFEYTHAKVSWTHPNVVIKTNMKYCGGSLYGSGTCNTVTGASKFKMESEEVDLKKVFKQWNNFDQNQVLAKHIKGKGDIQCIGSFIYLPGKEWNSKSLNLLGGLHIDKGELHNVPVFKQFSTYIHAKDLSHIKFNSLSNVFKIEKGRFHLPEMFIQSNAANIIMAGHQTLDNEISYALKINAGQILTNKLKKHDPKLRPIKAKKKGFFNLHYIIKGPIDNFEYFSDKRRVADKFEQSLFLRDEIILELGSTFDIGDRYQSPHLFQDIPEIDESDEDIEYLDGFE